MGSGHSTEAVVEEEEEPGPTQIPTPTTGLGSAGEDIAYQEIVSEPPQGSDGMEPFRRAVGTDVTGGSPAAGAVGRGGSVTNAVHAVLNKTLTHLSGSKGSLNVIRKDLN